MVHWGGRARVERGPRRQSRTSRVSPVWRTKGEATSAATEQTYPASSKTADAEASSRPEESMREWLTAPGGMLADMARTVMEGISHLNGPCVQALSATNPPAGPMEVLATEAGCGASGEEGSATENSTAKHAAAGWLPRLKEPPTSRP